MLKVDNLNFSYGEREILKNLTLEVKKGDFLGILGANGAGKSTFFKLLSGVLTPESGDIFLQTRPIKDFSRLELARKMAVVPQEPPGDFPFTCREFVMMGRFPYLGFLGSETDHDRELVEQALNKTQTLPLADRRLNQLSGGERQRVTLARALAQEGELLLLDEPTSHLDIAFQLNTLEILRDINRNKGVSVVIILHDLNLAARFCRNLLLLKGGKIFASGSPKIVLTRENLETVFRVKTRVEIRDGLPLIALEESCEKKAEILEKQP